VRCFYPDCHQPSETGISRSPIHSILLGLRGLRDRFHQRHQGFPIKWPEVQLVEVHILEGSHLAESLATTSHPWARPGSLPTSLRQRAPTSPFPAQENTTHINDRILPLPTLLDERRTHILMPSKQIRRALRTEAMRHSPSIPSKVLDGILAAGEEHVVFPDNQPMEAVGGAPAAVALRDGHLSQVGREQAVADLPAEAGAVVGLEVCVGAAWSVEGQGVVGRDGACGWW
jgi:hypothetical protein